MENILTTQGIKQAFPIGSGREFVALHDINIQIPKGKLTMLRGRSGSGKTTLMNILSALDYPKEGTVVFEGAALEQMNDHEREEFRKNNVGFVFQSVALIPMMTAYENVEFLLRLAKYPGNKRARAEECLRSWDLASVCIICRRNFPEENSSVWRLQERSHINRKSSLPTSRRPNWIRRQDFR